MSGRGAQFNMPFDGRASLIGFENSEFRYDPFPIGVVRNVFEAATYEGMLREWPPLEKFKHFAKWGNKYSLSEFGKQKEYHDFVRGSELWSRVHDEIKSAAFIDRVIDFLAEKRIDPGLKGNWVPARSSGLRLLQRLRAMGRGFMLKSNKTVQLTSYLEFSMLPSDGGCLRPHTDDPRKIITLVFSIVGPGEWKREWGGGTAIVRPRDVTANFNFLNKMIEFDQVEEIGRYEFEPNQCIVFVKTFNSWHSVPLMKSGRPDVFRRSLTLNIEIA
jgi:hypothetical protein